MGWLWDIFGIDDTKPSSKDPLRDLDPDLRDYLKKESPVKYSSTNPQSTTQVPTSPKSTHQPIQPTTNAEKDKSPIKRPIPTAFPDGRYADLWKSYRPREELEAEAKSDQEKINDILDGYNHRKAQIGRAALENCALEQWDVNECFQSGGWHARMTMCRAENRKFERCYTMQSKFLKALGYLSTFDRPKDVDEEIQMHADTLYHRMLDQEKQIEAAEAEGKPVPSFSPLLSSRKPHDAITPATAPAPSFAENRTQPSDLPERVQTELKKRLEGLNPEEREVEERAIKAEIQAGEEIAGNLGKIYQTQAEERQKRRQQGRETIGDRITSLLGR